MNVIQIDEIRKHIAQVGPHWKSFVLVSIDENDGVNIQTNGINYHLAFMAQSLQLFVNRRIDGKDNSKPLDVTSGQ